MNKKIINFNDKKINKSDFYNKDKKIFNIDDIDVNKILVSKKRTINTFLGIMIMVLLDYYIYFCYKQLTILINLIKIK